MILVSRVAMIVLSRHQWTVVWVLSRVMVMVGSYSRGSVSSNVAWIFANSCNNRTCEVSSQPNTTKLGADVVEFAGG